MSITKHTPKREIILGLLPRMFGHLAQEAVEHYAADEAESTEAPHA